MRAQHDNIVLRQTFILIVAGAFTANAQTLVGTLGAMGIAGTLQSINSTAAINVLNAVNGLTGIPIAVTATLLFKFSQFYQGLKNS